MYVLNAHSLYEDLGYKCPVPMKKNRTILFVILQEKEVAHYTGFSPAGHR